VRSGVSVLPAADLFQSQSYVTLNVHQRVLRSLRAHRFHSHTQLPSASPVPTRAQRQPHRNLAPTSRRVRSRLAEAGTLLRHASLCDQAFHDVNHDLRLRRVRGVSIHLHLAERRERSGAELRLWAFPWGNALTVKHRPAGAPARYPGLASRQGRCRRRIARGFIG